MHIRDYKEPGEVWLDKGDCFAIYKYVMLQWEMCPNSLLMIYDISMARSKRHFL